MPRAWGVDLGGDYTYVGVWSDKGRFTPRASAGEQQTKTPTVVAFDGHVERWLWGWGAIRAATAVEVCKPRELIPEHEEEVLIGGYHHRCDDLVVDFLSHVFDQQSDQNESALPEACAFVVPEDWGYLARRRLLSCARRVGIMKPLLINAADATVLGYGLDAQVASDAMSRVLVSNFGPDRVSLSLLEVRNEDGCVSIDVVTSDAFADDRVDGTENTISWLASELALECPSDWQTSWVYPEMLRLVERALSNDDEASVEPALVDGVPRTIPVTELRRRLRSQSLSISNLLTSMLADAGIETGDIEYVLPAGPGTRLMQQVHETRRWLQTGKLPLPPDATFETVSVRGAARWASLVSDESSGEAVHCESMPQFGLELDDGSVDRVLRLGDPNATETVRAYEAPPDCRHDLELQFCEGFARRAYGVRKLPDRKTVRIPEPGARLVLRFCQGDSHQVTVDILEPRQERQREPMAVHLGQ